MQSVVVTGISSGIGWGVAKVLIQAGFRVFGSVRKEQDAQKLLGEFGQSLIPLIFDVTDEKGVHAAAAEVRKQLRGETLFGLVNNAGIAVPAPMMVQPIDDFRHQMEVNLIGQVIVTQAFLPLLGADRSLRGKPGRIINMSSVAGKRGAPFLGAYVASKHALEGFSETLRRELMIYGIDVIIIGPGTVATPIWDKADELDTSIYRDTEYGESTARFKKYMIREGRKGLGVEKVGEVVLQALTISRPRLRYAVVPGRLINWTIPMLLPKRFIDGMIARNLGLKTRK